jgi:NTE family protein
MSADTTGRSAQIWDIGLISQSENKTAFVFAGGGSFGAIQVGMLMALAERGVAADLVVGSSVGAMNAAYYAAEPTAKNVQRLAEVWRTIRRQDVFPITLRTLAGFLWRRDFLVSQEGVRSLIRRHLPYKNLEEARIPVHVVSTDIVSGETVVLSSGSAEDAIVATTAIPGAFPPLRVANLYLSDGAISSNTPVRIAIMKGATRLVVLPTGFACAGRTPPVGAVANAIHALTLLIARQLSAEIDDLTEDILCAIVPPLCPLSGSPYDFSMTEAHIERAFRHTSEWLKSGGLESNQVPDAIRPHKHAIATSDP